MHCPIRMPAFAPARHLCFIVSMGVFRQYSGDHCDETFKAQLAIMVSSNHKHYAICVDRYTAHEPCLTTYFANRSQDLHIHKSLYVYIALLCLS